MSKPSDWETVPAKSSPASEWETVQPRPIVQTAATTPRGGVSDWLREQWKYLVTPAPREIQPGIAPGWKPNVPGIAELPNTAMLKLAEGILSMGGAFAPGGASLASMDAIAARALMGARAARAAPPAAGAERSVPALIGKVTPKPGAERSVPALIGKVTPKKPAAGLPIVPPAPANAVQQVIDAINAAEPVRGTQEAVYAASRAQRGAKYMDIAAERRGMAGLQEQGAVLSGELPKVSFTAPKVAPESADELANMLNRSPALPTWGDKATARTGLLKVLSGSLPQQSELEMLGRVFGRKFVDALQSTRPRGEKLMEAMKDIATVVPRALVAGYDASAPLWQGLFALPRYPREWGSAFVTMVKVTGSKTANAALGESIINSPRYAMADHAGLALTALYDPVSMLSREEAVMGLRMLGKIPVVGPLGQAAERAYSGFLMKFRWDIWNKLMDSVEQAALKAGLDPKQELYRVARSAAEFANTATGRGSLGSLEKAAPVLTNVMFSPRLTASVVKTLSSFHYYKNLEPEIRKEALKTLGYFATAASITLGALHQAGANVILDPRRADFGSLIVGNRTRLGLLGPLGPYIRLLAVMATGETVSPRTGKTIPLGTGFGQNSKAEMIVKFLTNKAAPGLTSVLRDIAYGETPLGKPLTDMWENIKRVIPMFVADVIDAAREDPAALPFLPLAFFGMKYTTYEDRPPVIRPRMPRLRR